MNLRVTLTPEDRLTLATLRVILRRGALIRGPSDRMEAVIIADFVAESVAKLAAEAIGLQVPRDAFLPKVLGDLSVALRGHSQTLQYEKRIRYLHEIRNLVQHRAQLPPADVAERARDDVDDFGEELVATVWGVPFRKLAVTDQIDDARLRRVMEIGAAALESGDRELALRAVAVAGDQFHTLIGKGPRWVFTGRWRDELMRAFGGSGTNLHRFDQIAIDLQELTNRIAVLEAGMSGPDYQWFVEHIPSVTWTLDGLGHIWTLGPGPSLAELARGHELLMNWILTTRLALRVPPPPEKDTPAPEDHKIPVGWPDEKPGPGT